MRKSIVGLTWACITLSVTSLTYGRRLPVQTYWKKMKRKTLSQAECAFVDKSVYCVYRISLRDESEREERNKKYKKIKERKRERMIWWYVREWASARDTEREIIWSLWNYRVRETRLAIEAWNDCYAVREEDRGEDTEILEDTDGEI